MRIDATFLQRTITTAPATNDNWFDEDWQRRNILCADFTALLHACADMPWGLKLLRGCGYLP